MNRVRYSRTEINSKLKAIITNIRIIRERKNYSQEYMATKLNISQNTYSKMELGYTALTLYRLLAIAQILEISVVELLNN